MVDIKDSYMRELVLLVMLLIVSVCLMLSLYDRALTPTCTVTEPVELSIPKDWMVEPPKMEVRP